MMNTPLNRNQGEMEVDVDRTHFATDPLHLEFGLLSCRPIFQKAAMPLPFSWCVICAK